MNYKDNNKVNIVVLISENNVEQREKDGRKYVGQFQDGKMAGQGTFTGKQGKNKYKYETFFGKNHQS